MHVTLMAASAFFALAAPTAQIEAPQAIPGARVRSILAEEQKIVSDHGIDEAKAVDIGGLKQWITVRGRDTRNPILLFLHGGPASPKLPNRYLFEAPWTDYFTVVEWDQRGAGKTYALNDPIKVGMTMSEPRVEADAEAMVAYLRKTYGKKKIFVLGHSWGSILGLELAQKRPDWLYAYIGMGQVIDTKEAEAIGYAATLRAARVDNNDQAVEALTDIAPYPGSGDLSVEKVLLERKWSDYYGGLTHNRRSYVYWSDSQYISPDYTSADLLEMNKGVFFR